MRRGAQTLYACVTKSWILKEKSQLKTICFFDQNRKIVGYCKKCRFTSRMRTINNHYPLLKKDEKKSPNYLDSMFRSS
ncbi:hypothetical protein, partial [uncultured Parabacteroides sp.]|uniref:hypothetical protein n=1 Tax=uncultured Parabacteroides sp. TaxID=512312 RepID=UPI00263B3E2E